MTFLISSENQRKIHDLAKALNDQPATAAANPEAPAIAVGNAHGTKPGGSRAAPRNTMQEQLAATYQTMARPVMLGSAIYFALLVPVQAMLEDLTGTAILGGHALITAVIAILFYREFGRRTLDHHGLEWRTLALSGLVYAGLVAHHALHLEPPRLVYFAFLTLMATSISISMRVAAANVVVPFVTMMGFAYLAGPDTFEQYLFVGIAAGVVSFLVAGLTRTIIRRELAARMLAEQLRESAQMLADSDMLTGLPNRRHFFAELKASLDRKQEKGRVIAVGIIDLDGFKPVNDSFGHVVGDKLLFEVGRRLKHTCGKECFVARLGGDEFALLTTCDQAKAGMQALGERILHELRKPYAIAGTHMSISASIGFVCEEDTAMTESELLECADYALYRAKEKKSSIEIYTSTHDADRRRSDLIEHHLRISDRENEFYLMFQPKVDIRSGKTGGFEALARWDSPSLGAVAPDQFVPVAEKSGLVEELTPMLLRKALETASHWPGHLKLSFNLSVRDLNSPKSVERITKIVRASRFPAARLEFEVTETMVMTDFDRIGNSLAALRATGAGIALDDFGVGYSNFEKIDRLAISTLKIDRSFVQRLKEGERAGAVMQTMIDLCRRLEIECVVEGVENEMELAAVKAAGARYVQGYYFSKPMRSDELAAFLLGGEARDMQAADMQSADRSTGTLG